jgi:hypothetical protein
MEGATDYEGFDTANLDDDDELNLDALDASQLPDMSISHTQTHEASNYTTPI